MNVSFADFKKSLRIYEMTKRFNEVVDTYIAETEKIRKMYDDEERRNLALTALLNTNVDFPKLPVTFDDIQNAKCIADNDYFSAHDVMALEKFL